MTIVQPTDFIGDVNIPNNGDTYNGIASNVSFFINKYEPIFLESLLGYDLYQLYLAGIEVDPIDPKWTALQAQLKPLIVNFIYYYFKEDEYTYSAGIGVVRAKGENSTPISPARKMVSRWNEMVNSVYKVVKYWDADTYGDYYINFSMYWFNWFNIDALSFFVYGRFQDRIPNIFYTNNTFQI